MDKYQINKTTHEPRQGIKTVAIECGVDRWMQPFGMPRQGIAPSKTIEIIDRVTKGHLIHPVTPGEARESQTLFIERDVQYLLQHAGDHRSPVILKPILAQYLANGLIVSRC